MTLPLGPEEPSCRANRKMNYPLLTIQVLLEEAETIACLLENGANPCLIRDDENEWYQSPLHLAAAASSLETLQLLLQHVSSEKIDVCNRLGHSPLYLALQRGRTDHVRALLNKGANRTGGGIDDEFVTGLTPEVQTLIAT